MSTVLGAGRVREARQQIERRRFRGLEGLDEIAADVRCVVPDPASFAADVRVIRIAGLAIHRVVATPVRCMAETPTRCDQETVRFVSVVRGRLHIGRPGAAARLLEEGAVFAVQEHELHLYQADRPVDLVTVVLPAAVLPPRPQLFADGSVHVFPASPVAQVVHDLVVSFSSGAPSSTRYDPVYAANGLIHLLGAMVAQDSVPGARVTGVCALHAAAMEVVERLLHDPDLGPAQVAEELGVSVRYLHRAFEDQDTTVARYIRRRRTELANDAMLRWPDGSAATELIARRFGFRDESALLRALRERSRACSLAGGSPGGAPTVAGRP